MRVNEELFHFYLFTVSLSFTLAWPRIAQSVKHKEAIKNFILLETNQIMKKKTYFDIFKAKLNKRENNHDIRDVMQ